ncbi:MAG: hypothetical protein HY904_25490 [Deltaproteobacteria bacterium]|nr:hypothetical protein [Deltaproteobacteria bacterium]
MRQRTRTFMGAWKRLLELAAGPRKPELNPGAAAEAERRREFEARCHAVVQGGQAAGRSSAGAPAESPQR